MARGKNEVLVELLGDASSLQRAARKATGSLGDIDKKAKTTGSKLGNFAKTAGLGLAGLAAGAGVAAISLGVDFVHAAEEARKVTRQTDAVIKSTGGTAKVTAGEVAKLAEKLSMKAGIDDDLIQSGENMLLTFTNVRNEVGKGNDIFTQATKIALDMSVATGTDLVNANVQLGKALNDPIKGIGALTRVGVTFTDQQKEQIKKLVESGNVMDAQKIILAELTKEFGGSAEAQATASDKLAVAFDNIKEKLGNALLPLVERFSEWMINEGVPWIEDHLIPAIEKFAAWVSDELMPAVEDFVDFVERNWPTISEIVENTFDKIKAAFDVFGGVLKVFTSLLNGDWKGAWEGMKQIFRGVWDGIVADLKGKLIVLKAIAGDAAGAVGRFFQRTWNNIKSWASTAVNAVVGFITGIPGRIAGAAGRIGTLIHQGINAAFRWVRDVAGRIVDAILSIPRRIAGVGGRIRDAIVRGIGNIDLSPGFDIPGVPFLAHGGIIPATPGGRLFVGGEAGHDEAVIPLDGRHGMGGPTVNIYVAGSIRSDKDIIKLVRDEIARGGMRGVLP